MKQGKIFIILLFLTFTSGIYAQIEPWASPEETSSYTLEDIYQRLKYGTTGSMSTFMEPESAPNSTMHSLNDIMDVAGFRLIQKTGQTTSYSTGDDGDKEEGIIWPASRFTDNYDGTITDNLTGLVWLQQCGASDNWEGALNQCNILSDNTPFLSDGSAQGDWRLPNINELSSILDYSQSFPALPNGHPFSNLLNDYYWTSTTNADNTFFAFTVNIANGSVDVESKTQVFFILAVRNGN